MGDYHADVNPRMKGYEVKTILAVPRMEISPAPTNAESSPRGRDWFGLYKGWFRFITGIIGNITTWPADSDGTQVDKILKKSTGAVLRLPKVIPIFQGKYYDVLHHGMNKKGISEGIVSWTQNYIEIKKKTNIIAAWATH